jgi:hypothetical protein
MQLVLQQKKRSANTFGFIFPEQAADVTVPVLRRMLKRQKVTEVEDNEMA